MKLPYVADLIAVAYQVPYEGDVVRQFNSFDPSNNDPCHHREDFGLEYEVQVEHHRADFNGSSSGSQKDYSGGKAISGRWHRSRRSQRRNQTRLCSTAFCRWVKTISAA